ncbi:hypothetical protein, partial [Enterococcus faecium]|uniref:hypothetical protein n=1 Tax=Enterococcus faecium TaxID=1352 RepID=UPI003F434D06
MASFLQLGTNRVDENGNLQHRIKKTGNRFGGESGYKGGYGAGLVAERKARHKKLATLRLTEQI